MKKTIKNQRSIFPTILLLTLLSSCVTPPSSQPSLSSLPSSTDSSLDVSSVSSSPSSEISSESSSATVPSSSELIVSSLPTFTHTYVAAPGPDDFFLYWQHVATGKLVSRETPFTTDVTSIDAIQAIYGRQGEYDYSTQFEGTKASYRRDEVVLEQRSWIFDDAVFGSLAGDKVESGRAVRMHGGGFIQTNFAIQSPSSVTFKTAVYGSDTPGANLAIQWSQDGWFWKTYDEVTPTSQLSLVHVEFDVLTMYLDDDYEPSLPVYIKLLNQNNASPLSGVRLNIDSLVFNRHMDALDFPVKDHVNEAIVFSYNDDIPTVLEKHSSYTLPTCSYRDETTGNSGSCTATSSLDLTRRGHYSVTYSMMDSFGYTIEDRYTITVLDDLAPLSIDYSGYYDGIEGLYGRDLQRVLRQKSYASLQAKPYADGKTVLPLSDVDPLDATRGIAIYTGVSVPSTWDGGVTWQREHVWPNSRLGVRRVAENDANVASDLHNLRFIESSINASRSNKLFDAETTSNTYFPGDDAGDVARIMFYMVMKYDQLRLEDILPTDQVYMSQGAIGGRLSYLLEAHETDPVSMFEAYRHSVIQTYQGNPNPFIDYPYLVNLMML
jgi:endonuclease I